jgi:cytochrome c553
MKLFSAAALVALMLGTAHAQSSAERELLEFQLFTDGRGMVLSPRVAKKLFATAASPLWPLVRATGESRGGMIAQGRGFIGLHAVRYRESEAAVLGCAMCHAGKAAGRLIPGLGNKTIDPYGGAEVLLGEWARDRRDLHAAKLRDGQRELTAGSLGYASMVTRRDLANRTQGTVPAAWVLNWLYESSGRELPDRLRMPGAVKVPHLWGYARKREAGLFCDGMGDGSQPGWLAAVPLTAGLPAQAVRDHRSDLRRLEEVLSALQPPAYPFEIAPESARAGRRIFHKQCSGCHGNYEKSEAEAPRWISIETVQTDRERLRLTSGNFREVVARNPLDDLIRAHPQAGKGYLAPRLEGIWARFPYLHNGSVPSLRAMLTPPEARPRFFSLKRAGELERFSKEAGGLTIPAAGSQGDLALQFSARQRSRHVYDTSQPGQSNRGHPFGTNLPEEEKGALLEYLKTL